MTYKARRRWSLFILVVGLPAYIVLVVTLMSNTTEWPRAVQFVLYVVLGVAWVFPLKFVFKGIGQSDPDAD
ncbi:Protein of unknown function [Cognatiyoonia koreensis]|uniref:DUF2842 domain-containing protein n=1 Tax=Cognatiyoonia koreensis TaxID=364200 RepID=A0A1I0Q638_9RHOB|nr:DUF2842 domain-containing protein [Cognatiyoonia koreensis]SEW22398.1 Protein of unknown function [Cognatiyoonia koreensis]